MFHGTIHLFHGTYVPPRYLLGSLVELVAWNISHKKGNSKYGSKK